MKQENSLNHKESQTKQTLVLEDVQSCVSAMIQLHKQKEDSKKVSLFKDEESIVYLTVTCIKVPKMKSKNFKYRLPNSIVSSSSNVALFVRDLRDERKRKTEPEATIEHYKDLLKASGIESVSQIIPTRQLLEEYDTFEARRRLVNQFDFFLCDNGIYDLVLNKLGSDATRRRKYPIPVHFNGNLKAEFDRALQMTVMPMCGNGGMSSMKVGCMSQTIEQISENILAVDRQLSEKYPGGWLNIHKLAITLQDSVPIPLYMFVGNPNEVHVPFVVERKPLHYENAVGELSTSLNHDVIVKPSGEVITRKHKITKEDRELFEKELVYRKMIRAQKEAEEKQVKYSRFKRKPLKIKSFRSDENDDNDSDGNSEIKTEKRLKVDDSDGDEVIDAAENAYLDQLQKTQNEIKKQNKKRKVEMGDDVEEEHDEEEHVEEEHVEEEDVEEEDVEEEHVEEKHVEEKHVKEELKGKMGKFVKMHRKRKASVFRDENVKAGHKGNKAKFVKKPKGKKVTIKRKQKK